MVDEARNRLRCPECKQSISLWEGVEVPGWRAIDAHGCPLSAEHEVDWMNARPDGDVGCGECGWEGRRRQLEEVGLGDRVLTKNLDQLQIEVESD